MTSSLPAPQPHPNPLSSRAWGFAVFMGVLLLLFMRSLWDTARFALSADYYSYVVLIPVVSGYLISLKVKEVPAQPHCSIAPALLLIAVGALALGYAFKHPGFENPADEHALKTFSFLAFLIAGGFLFFGSGVLRAFAFPVAFLLFATPMPTAAVQQIQIWLQHASAEAAYWMLFVTNTPMVRSGVDFLLPGISIRVAEECSGFNSSFVLFLVSLVGGHLFFKKTRSKVILALAVIPLAIIRNGFRITTISLLCVHVGPEMIHSPIHHRGGPIFFALSMIPFAALIWVLRRYESRGVKQKP